MLVEAAGRDRWIRIFAGAGMLAAGVLHLAVAAEHWAHAPAHGLFFVLSGIAQIVWSIAFWRTPSAALQRLGLVLAAVLVLLWGVTRVVTAPFAPGAEEVDAAGLATKACEVVCAAALTLMIVASAGPAARRRSWRLVMGLALAALVLTGLTYGAARAAEPLLPGLQAEEHHSHEHTPGDGPEASPAAEEHDHEHDAATAEGGSPTPAEHDHEHDHTPAP